MPEITRYVTETDSKDLSKQHTDALPLTCPSLLQCSLRQGYFHHWIIVPHYSHCKAVGLELTREYLNPPGRHSEEDAMFYRIHAARAFDYKSVLTLLSI